jgi:hypothetical protein
MRRGLVGNRVKIGMLLVMYFWQRFAVSIVSVLRLHGEPYVKGGEVDWDEQGT